MTRSRTPWLLPTSVAAACVTTLGLVAPAATAAETTTDTTAPTITVKPESVGTDGVYRSVSFKLFDAGKVDGLTLNGVDKDLTDNAWSDLNGVRPGVFGAVEGTNTLVVRDVAGNTTTLVFTLDTTGPQITVKPESVGADGVFGTVSFKLHDAAAKVDGLTLNGVDKDLTDNAWSDLNGVRPGVFGAVEGTNTLVVRDTLGNTTTLVFTLDATGPEVTAKPESVGAQGSYKSLSLKLHDTAAKVDKVTVNGVVKDLTDDAWSDVNGLRPGVFGAVEGANTLVAYDTLGNTTTYRFRLDTGRPVVHVTAPVDGAVVRSGDVGRVALDVTDEGGLQRVSANLYRDGKLVKALGSTSASTALGTTTWSGGWGLPQGLAEGTWTVRTGATDLATNWGGDDVTFTVDDTAPVVTVPASGAVTTDASVSFDVSQAEDHLGWAYAEVDQLGTDGKWMKISGQRLEGQAAGAFAYTVDGHALTAGTTTQVKVTAVDAAGNRSSATFPVTVSDPAPAVVPATPVTAHPVLAAVRQALAGFWSFLRGAWGW